MKERSISFQGQRMHGRLTWMSQTGSSRSVVL